MIPDPDESNKVHRSIVRRAIFWTCLAHIALVVVLYSVFWLPYREPQKSKPRLLKMLPDSGRLESANVTDIEPTEFGWVDQEKGIVRIPVSEAERIVLDRLPVRQGPRPTIESPPLGSGSGRPVGDRHRR